MNNIPLYALTDFNGQISEDPNTFLFEFDILCRSYDYTTDAKKLKIFPATLKGSTLRWFMGLGVDSITSWDNMKQTFLKNYQDYCKTRDPREELFKMSQKEEESLEDYVECLKYNLQRSKHNYLDKDILKTILIRGTRDDYLDMMNLMGTG
jgi:hypothetical protein